MGNFTELTSKTIASGPEWRLRNEATGEKSRENHNYV